MLKSPREEREGKLQMLLSLRKNGLTSLFKEVRVFKDFLRRPPLICLSCLLRSLAPVASPTEMLAAPALPLHLAGLRVEMTLCMRWIQEGF